MPTDSSSGRDQHDTNALEHAAKALQVACARVLAELPSDKLGQVATHLKISRTLAWKIMSVAGAQDALASASHVPGPRGMALFTKSASRLGVREALVQDVSLAWERFHQVAGKHATSRPQMRSLVAGISPGAKVELQHRKAATRANCHIWNWHARVTYTAVWVFDAGEPGRSRNKADVVMVSGPIGLSTFRPRHRVIVNRVHPNAAAGPLVRPLIPDEASPDGLPLLRRFSTNPLPPLHCTTLPDGTQIHEFEPKSIGQLGEQTLLFGVRISDGEFRSLPAGDPTIGAFCRLRRPTDLMYIELYLDRSVYPTTLPVYGAVLDAMEGSIPSPLSTIDHLAIDCHVEHIEDASSALPSHEIPHHDEIRGTVYDLIGKRPGDFHLHRMALPYPPTPSVPYVFAQLE